MQILQITHIAQRNEVVVWKEVNVMGETKEKARKPGRFKSLQAEFKKVVWPDKMTLAKQTTAVVIITVLIGVIITIADIFLKYGIDLLVR